MSELPNIDNDARIRRLEQKLREFEAQLNTLQSNNDEFIRLDSARAREVQTLQRQIRGVMAAYCMEEVE